MSGYSFLAALVFRISASFKLGLHLELYIIFIISSIVIGNEIERLGVRPSFQLTGELPGEATQLAQ